MISKSAVMLAGVALCLASCQQASQQATKSPAATSQKQQPSAEAVKAAFGEPRTAATIDKFVELCVSNIDDLERVVAIAKAEGWKPTPGSERYGGQTPGGKDEPVRYLSYDIPETSEIAAVRLSMSNVGAKYVDGKPTSGTAKKLTQCHFDFTASADDAQARLKNSLPITHKFTNPDKMKRFGYEIYLFDVSQSYEATIKNIPVLVIMAGVHASGTPLFSIGKEIQFTGRQYMNIQIAYASIN